ncbi:MAG: 2Fe-2S iron-sulfur cluster binding domain-containing protein [Gammaproteobacteria bacterium]|nr:2Fe-2S iron-sulfur cluster binding domain-containing protein [Gammaproteobacteria bacterium]
MQEHESILDAAIRQGHNLPHSCRGGSCHSCKARVTFGDFHYPNGTPWSLSEEDLVARQCLICLAHADSDMQIIAKAVETPAEIQIKRLPCRIEKKILLCHDVMALHLRLPRVEPFQFLAGQYIDILLPDGRRRSFSIANPPHDAGLLEIHVRRVPDGSFTSQVFDALPERSLLRIEGPIGNFFVRKNQRRPIIMLGGGTGIAPLLGMLRDLLENQDDHGVHLFWGARQTRDLYLHDHLLEMASDYEQLMYSPVLSEAESGENWKGRSGWVHEAVLEDYPNMSPFDVYMAGPPPMVEAAKLAFTDAGLAHEQLFYDSFEFGADVIQASMS